MKAEQYGAVVYRGPSRLDPRIPIVVVLTFYTVNTGTGDMAQTWILRADSISPLEAIRTGQDTGNCPESCTLRPRHSDEKGRAQCYAASGRTAFSLQQMYRAAVDGRYPTLTVEDAALRIANRRLRIGAYGDPAAVPISVWAGLIRYTRGHTGYTHAIEKAPLLGTIVMVSADSAEQALRAQARGYRTYRVRHVDSDGNPEPLLAGEVVCPKSEEGGHRSTCGDCLLCDGTGGRSPRSIAIIDHSTSARSRTVKRRLPLVSSHAPRVSRSTSHAEISR